MRTMRLHSAMVCACLIGLTGVWASTFDGEPWRQDWMTIPTPRGDIQIANNGDAVWDGVRLFKMLDLAFETASAEMDATGGNPVLHIRGQSADFAVELTMQVHTNEGRAVIRAGLTPKVSAPPAPRFEMLVTGFNTNPRFDSMQAGEPVTGRMMDLDPDHALDLERYFEVGPLKTGRAELGEPWSIKRIDISTNLVFGARGMPMEAYGLRSTSVWAGPAGVTWQQGRTETFEIEVCFTSEDEPRRRAAPAARSVTAPRVWRFLVDDPPIRSGAWECEMRPADRHAPVFAAHEEPAIRVRWRPVDTQLFAAASLSARDAYSGKQAVAIGSLQASRDSNGWREAHVALGVPAGSVYDCFLHLTDAGGAVTEARLGEVVRTARIPQPVVSRSPLPWMLVDTIDCTDSADRHPFYSAGGASRVVDGPAGRYRLTATVPGDWFGYRFVVPAGAAVMRIEVEYPDDAPRDVGVSVNEPIDPDRPGNTWGQIRTSTGYFSGLVFPQSNTMRTFDAIYFPNSPWATVEVMNTAWSDRSAPAAVKAIRIYRLKGELPQLPGYDRAPERVFATWSEQGPIAALSFNADPDQRGGHSHFGKDPAVSDEMPKEHFYRHWYQVVRQHVRYLRYRGDTGYVYGAVMYTTSRYPSRYMEHRMGYADARFDPAALYAALFGDNGLKVLFNVELTTDYRMYQSLHLTDHEVQQGAPTALAVNSEGRQQRLKRFTGTMELNYQDPLFRDIYSDIVCELAQRYGRYPGAAGVVSHAGGIWLPMYFDEDTPLNDSAAAAFAAFAGVTLPGDASDPNRFAVRWRWIQANAAGAWRDFRAVLLRDIHKQIARRLHAAAPDWQYVISQYGSGYDAYITGQIDRPLDYELKAGFDPRLYRDIEGATYNRHIWGVYRTLTQPEWLPVFERTGPLGNPDSPATKFQAYVLDSELAAAFEGHPRTSTLIHAQFDEHSSWTHIDPGHPWVYRGIQPNIQYAQPVDADMQFEFALAYAQNTPDDVFYTWTDGAVQMGHEPRMQAIARFLRALPRGIYTNDPSVPPPAYVRRLQGSPSKFLYAVNTAREPVEVRVTADAPALRDCVSGELLRAGEDGVVRMALEPFALRAFEAEAGFRGRRGWFPRLLPRLHR